MHPLLRMDSATLRELITLKERMEELQGRFDELTGPWAEPAQGAAGPSADDKRRTKARAYARAYAKKRYWAGRNGGGTTGKRGMSRARRAKLSRARHATLARWRQEGRNHVGQLIANRRSNARLVAA